MPHRMGDAIEGVRNCIVGLVDMQRGQYVLVLTDSGIDPIYPQTVAAVCKEIGAEPMVLSISISVAEASEVVGREKAMGWWGYGMVGVLHWYESLHPHLSQ